MYSSPSSSHTIRAVTGTGWWKVLGLAGSGVVEDLLAG
jgi:hypothetical protein